MYFNMKIPAWKIVLYILIAAGLAMLYYAKLELALLALAPAGLIVFLVESMKQLLELKNWKNLASQGRNNIITLYIILALVLAVNVLVGIEVVSALR